MSFILRPVEHFDLADLPDDMAAEMGRLLVARVGGDGPAWES